MLGVGQELVYGDVRAILAADVFFGLHLVAVPPNARAGITILVTWLYSWPRGRRLRPSGLASRTTHGRPAAK